ncbi:hypothetical protein ABE61_00510 [Lysinibacillus sphaericus]|uniref:hypothetical protein n=1 Tax=Lysinibacillus sphaericus TaxID=1421 RepID=UPI0018CEFD22|nr:hypothetical protein [Lysinibacillus sphaericus]MBG9452605.1 hypothetical protein [Lysinibacillus sphaericus]MBG9476985.1 hypothetical protein [Lysinibacillus sphaericus]MBG9592754.1 hypothetical protein [Lysinibacillus sphaericus]
MFRNLRLYSPIVTAILFVILVFMNYLGYWTPDRFIQILFFFIMVVSVFNAGIRTEEILKSRGKIESSR